MSWCVSIRGASGPEELPERLDRLRGGSVGVRPGERLRGRDALVADLGKRDGERLKVEVPLPRRPTVRVDEMNVADEARRVLERRREVDLLDVHVEEVGQKEHIL